MGRPLPSNLCFSQVGLDGNSSIYWGLCNFIFKDSAGGRRKKENHTLCLERFLPSDIKKSSDQN